MITKTNSWYLCVDISLLSFAIVDDLKNNKEVTTLMLQEKEIQTYMHSMDSNAESSRKQLIRFLFDEYIEMYVSRDERLISRFSDNFSGYAGSSDVLITDKQEWINVTLNDFEQIPERINIKILDVSLQDLAEAVVAVTAFFNIQLPSQENILSNETARLVLIFRNENGIWKITHSGISIPYGLANEGEIYPLSQLEKRNLELEKIINIRTKELSEANNLLRIQSNTDGLTNINNRRYFDFMLNEEWSRGQQSNTPLAMIMLDIDHFKSFNDQYGHLIGDDCLQKLAHGLSQSVFGGAELVARFGGEEFAILLPRMDGQAAFKVAKHIQEVILSLAIPHVTSPNGVVTVSFGVASVLPSSDKRPIDLVGLADKALYRAKTAGRNCIKM